MHLLIGLNTEKILLSESCPTLSVGAHVLAGIDLAVEVNAVVQSCKIRLRPIDRKSVV